MYIKNSGEHARKNFNATSSLIEKMMTPAIPNPINVNLHRKLELRCNSIHDSHKNFESAIFIFLLI